MPSNVLTKKWIQYLKSNQIAGMQSDPKTGRLNYRRKVTTDDLIHFLQNDTDYTDEQIDGAIEKVLSGKPKQTKNLPAVSNQQQQGTNNNLPAQPQQQQPQNKQQQIGLDNVDVSGAPKQKKYSNTGDITDVEPKYKSQDSNPQQRTNVDAIAPYGWNARTGKEFASQEDRDKFFKDVGLPDKRAANTNNQQPKVEPQQPKQRTGGKQRGVVSQTPNAIRKRAERARKKAAGTLEEDFVDDPGEELDEKDVEAVFAELGTVKSNNKPGSQGQDKKVNDVEKIKGFIKNTLSPKDRKALYDLIAGETVAESLYENFEKNVDLHVLREDWQNAGYPESAGEIAFILYSYGFNESTIEKVLDNVLNEAGLQFGTKRKYNRNNYYSNNRYRTDKNTETDVSPAIQQLAEYIKKNNLTKEVVEFLKQEFPDVTKDTFGQKIKKFGAGVGKNIMGKFKDKFTTHEDVKKIFTLILNERRYNIQTITEKEALGRNKKINIDENNVHDVLKADQYVTILRHLKTTYKDHINLTGIKNHIIHSWKKGMKSRKHYDKLLNSIDINLSDLIDK